MIADETLRREGSSGCQERTRAGQRSAELRVDTARRRIRGRRLGGTCRLGTGTTTRTILSSSRSRRSPPLGFETLRCHPAKVRGYRTKLPLRTKLSRDRRSTAATRNITTRAVPPGTRRGMPHEAPAATLSGTLRSTSPTIRQALDSSHRVEPGHSTNRPARGGGPRLSGSGQPKFPLSCLWSRWRCARRQSPKH